jgi:uncharacterized protein with von Willebrand factor type A (vWA) domain
MRAMDITLARFVAALRHAELEVSPAETLDALAVVRQVGVADPQLLQDALALTLAKTREEKARFGACFQRFFEQLAFRTPVKRSFFRTVDRARTLQAVESYLDADLREFVAAILHDNRAALALAVERAAHAAGIDSMHTLRDKAALSGSIAAALGLGELDALLGAPPDNLARDVLPQLRYLRHYVKQEIQQYLDTQYRLNVDATGRRAVVEAALAAHLTQIPAEYRDDVRAVIERLATRLAREHRRRRRRARRGQLDIKHTLRANIAFDGALFKLKFRVQRRDRATVFALCDVSGSVSRVARFLLYLLYDLAEALPELRTFAFSSRLGELTALFRDKPVDVAIEEALFDWGKGNTDYSRALLDFRDLALDDVDHRSTVIILGDARNNYYDPHPERLRDIARRAKAVWWLNPEAPEQWGEGDSEMPRFAPYCFRVRRCNSLTDLERFAEALLATQR